MNCPVCSGNAITKQYDLYDDRYGYPGTFELLVCTLCGHKFLGNAPVTEALNDIYTQYYPRAAFDPDNFEPYREPLRVVGWLNGDFSSAARWVPDGVRVLDIGCGLGCNVAYLAARGCHAYGVDADQNVMTIAEKYGLNIRIGQFNPSVYEPGFFDYVTMDQVVEHVTNPLSTLSDVNKVLRTGGYCVISTPNANGWGAWLFGGRWLNWHVPYHQQFFSERSMYLLAEETGFVVERILTITRSIWLAYQIAHLLTYPARERPSVFWAPEKNRRRLHHVVMLKLIMATRFTLVPQLITRLLDFMGRGDNYLIILKKV